MCILVMVQFVRSKLLGESRFYKGSIILDVMKRLKIGRLLDVFVRGVILYLIVHE